MMPIPFFLAHGALGPWDEIIFLGVIVVFLMFMGRSWLQSTRTEADPEDQPNPNTTDPASEQPEAQTDRFRMD